MAQNLATATYTLKLFKDNVRLQSSTLSQQESGLIEPMMNDIVHNAILLVRTLSKKNPSVEAFYENTKQSITVGSVASNEATVSLSTYSIADPYSIKLYHATMKEIPVYHNISDFLAVKRRYTLSATEAIAVLSIAAGSPNAFGLEFYTGAANGATISTTTMYYSRNPIKVTTDADTVDLPDHIVPIAQDIATVAVFRKVAKTPPTDIEARATAFINNMLNQLNIPVEAKL